MRFYLDYTSYVFEMSRLDRDRGTFGEFESSEFFRSFIDQLLPIFSICAHSWDSPINLEVP